MPRKSTAKGQKKRERINIFGGKLDEAMELLMNEMVNVRHELLETMRSLRTEMHLLHGETKQEFKRIDQRMSTIQNFIIRMENEDLPRRVTALEAKVG